MIAAHLPGRRFVALLSVLFASAVFISLIVWLRAFSHPLPHWDQWAFLLDYASVRDSGRSWLNFFFSQHNEHRIAVPRLFFMADLAWLHGRNTGLVIANVTAQALSWAGLCVLVWSRLHKPWDRVTAMALALAVLFSAAQAENFIWGFQVQFVGVYAAGIWACIFAMKRWTVPACLMAMTATLMMANGLFIWLVLLGLALVLKTKKGAVFTYAAGFFLSLGAYLFDFKSIDRHTSASYGLMHPVEFVSYLLAYLGGAGGLGRPSLAMCVGGIAAVLFGVLTLQAVRNLDKQSPPFWALWGVAAFVLISAGITTIGRVSFGVEQALAGRYVTPSSIFLVSLSFAWLSLARTSGPAGSTARGKRIATNGALALLLLGSLALVFANHVRNKAELAGRHQRADMSADAIATGVQDLRVYGMTYNDAEVIDKGAQWLKSAHLSIFAARPWSLFGRTVGVDVPIAPEGRCAGRIDDATPVAGQANAASPARVTGWAWDTQARRRPAHVLLVDPSNRVIGFASEAVPRNDVANAFRMPRALTSGWAGYSASGMPSAAYGLIDGESLACKLLPL